MLTGRVCSVKDLTEAQMQAMYAIMAVHYGNTDKGKFLSDLEKKRDVVLLTDRAGVIHGFTTLALFSFDEDTRLLYSGDTIVEKDYWGRHDLPRAWVRHAMALAEDYDGVTYWFLLSKGYKTYKYLSSFFQVYYPRVDTQTPPNIQHIMDTFARRQYGDQYRNGVWKAGHDFLREDYDTTAEAAARDKNSAFFLAKNPGYRQGDELICLCELCVDNLNKLGRRVLGR